MNAPTRRPHRRLVRRIGALHAARSSPESRQRSRDRRAGRIAASLLLGALVLSGAGWSAPQLNPDTLSRWAKAASTTTSAPRTPPVRICGDANLLNGPRRPPNGSVTVKAGNDDHLTLRPHTTYWFAPGLHTLGSGPYYNIVPATGDTFIGAPGATIDGKGINQSAFDGTAGEVTIKYLTIEHFVPPQGQGAVNHDSGPDWTIEYNTIEDNGGGRGSNLGGGLMMGSGDVYQYNCLTHNGEYGLNATGTTSPRNTVFSHNEVSYNGLAEFPDVKGCGCSGGAKFWATTNAVVEDNYVHDNYNVGLWFDTNNAGALVRGNYIARNWAEGLDYEISYNALIEYNTFLDNAWGVGSYAAAGFPMSALYISGSAGNAAVDGGHYSTLTVAANTFTDNWGGVVIYYNPNRVCGSAGNTSTGDCTLEDPSVFSTSSCSAHDGPNARPDDSPDYYNGCQWNADNIEVEGNTLSFDPHQIRTATNTLPDIDNSRCYSGPHRLDTSSPPPTGNSYWCGFNGLFSIFGSTAPYLGWAGPDAIMGLASNSDFGKVDTIRFTDNTYRGPWTFQAYSQGQSPVYTDLYPHGVSTTVTFAGWQSTWGQDKGSRIR